MELVCMSCKTKGQASIETLVAVLILLILFLFVLWQLSYMEGFRNSASAAYGSISECSRISGIINEISSSSAGQEITVMLEREAVISNRTVYVGNEYCGAYGPVSDANLAAGYVRIHKEMGVVYLENA